MVKLLSLFSGIGAFEKALENIGEPFEVVRYCEIDKYASKAYSLIHNLDENLNLKDVTTVKTDDLPNDIDLITYGFPCQDISIAGKQKGFQDEEGHLTRSGLFFEALRIIEDTQPKIAIAENVKALTGKRFTAEFKIVLDSLNDAGYTNYWAVLNAKDYGIPQNRERVFIISIRNDIDHGFSFPKKYELKLRLKDLLEDSVDEKYYLSDKMLDVILSSGTKSFYYKPEIDLDVARPLTSTMHKMHRAGTDNYVSESFVKDGVKTEIDDRRNDATVMQIGNLFPSEKRKNPNQGRLYDKNGISPTLSAMEGGNRQPFIVDEPNKNIKPVLVGGIGEKKSNGGTQYYQQNRVYDSDAIAMAHPAQIPEGSYKYLVHKSYEQMQFNLFDDSPTIQKIEIPQMVKVRKHEVDKDKLVEVLRKQKKLCGWSNKELAEELEIPATTVEHWFRTDDGFAIPDAEIWSDLKWLLEMDDIDEFDEAIMTFEEREGTYEKADRCYHENGISPTITVAMANEKIITALPIKEATKKGYKEAHEGDYVNLQYPDSETRRGRVGEQVANTLLCNDAQGVVVKDGCVQIGSLDRKGYHEFSNRVYSPDGTARTLMGEGGNNNDKAGQYIMPDLRIRKLTPKDCFRLMGFDDKDCDILSENGISNTQIYKMAGNSIVVDVLEEIFVELLNQYEDVFPI